MNPVPLVLSADANTRQPNFTGTVESSQKESLLALDRTPSCAVACQLKNTPSVEGSCTRIVSKEHHDSRPLRGSRRTVDLLGLEALVCVGITGHRNQLSDTAFAGVIAFAVQNKVDGFCGLRPHEAVVQIRPGT